MPHYAPWTHLIPTRERPAIAGHGRLPDTPTRCHLQDLDAHGMVDRVGDHPERWEP
jgi:hypothetical protein